MRKSFKIVVSQMALGALSSDGPHCRFKIAPHNGDYTYDPSDTTTVWPTMTTLTQSTYPKADTISYKIGDMVEPSDAGLEYQSTQDCLDLDPTLSLTLRSYDVIGLDGTETTEVGETFGGLPRKTSLTSGPAMLDSAQVYLEIDSSGHGMERITDADTTILYHY